jgi:hypothetical protein
LLDRLVEWDESLHPRAESGRFGVGSGGPSGSSSEKGGARGTSRSTGRRAGERDDTGAQRRAKIIALRAKLGRSAAEGKAPARLAEFVSPSVKSNLDFKGAVRELGSRQQTRLHAASNDINKKLGLEGGKEIDIIGAWKDGAENSIMSRTEGDWNKAVLATVMKGHLADQKSVLVFQQQERGVSVLAQFDAKGKLPAIHKALLKEGLENHTIVPKKDGSGATIYVVDLDGSNLKKIEKAAAKYDADAYFQSGRAEFIGNTDDTDDEGKPLSDREQRDRARSVYQSIIDQSTVKDAPAIWQNVRDHWEPPTGEKGYDLTPTALIRENPNIKHNSVNKEVAAKMMNGRAGKILQRDLGVDYLDEDNRTPERDDYLAGVIAMELREGLIGGASGEHWYDDTVKKAMNIAEEIYPGVKDDPHKRFIYTAVLAATSQGETVGNNVRLADEAYTHWEKTGKLPEDIKTIKPGPGQNMKKLNKLIADGGGGKEGIEHARQFFSEQMTARELTERTTEEPSATLKDDMVYGSAMMGPKIGQGFYQNLNGNFTPITMDLWFMRAWGRLTNTGVAEGGPKQMAKLTSEMEKAGLPVPETEKARIDAALAITAQHEKDFVKYRKEYDDKTRVKSALVKAAERVEMYHKGALVEQPRNGNQRKWITEVFNKALVKLEKDKGLKLTPAGAQATWWWPEKILWEEMGVTGKKRDTDYEKSLAELRDKKKKKS